jgi:hypothetical protein
MALMAWSVVELMVLPRGAIDNTAKAEQGRRTPFILSRFRGFHKNAGSSGWQEKEPNTCLALENEIT